MPEIRRQTANFSVYAVAGSFADRNLGLIASRLEGAYGVFASLLAIDAPVGERLDVYLPEILAPDETGGQTIVEAYRADDWDFIKFNPRWTYFGEAWGNTYERPTEQRMPRLTPSGMPRATQTISTRSLSRCPRASGW